MKAHGICCALDSHDRLMVSQRLGYRLKLIDIIMVCPLYIYKKYIYIYIYPYNAMYYYVLLSKQNLHE